MFELLIKETRYPHHDYRPQSAKSRTVVIEAKNEDEAFAIFFRDYVNRYKYVAELQFEIINPEERARYTKWIANPENYADNGGDMW